MMRTRSTENRPAAAPNTGQAPTLEEVMGVVEHTLLHPEALSGILDVDRDAMTVTARAGTPLKDLNLALERMGLSLHNMGDIAE
jgi:FAD/FMN-containing dehydrogenase